MDVWFNTFLFVVLVFVLELSLDMSKKIMVFFARLGIE
jgi:hypothetical protein